MVHPAAKKRGADSHVPARSKKHKDAKEEKLEQGLEESMGGSDPASITQPSPPLRSKRIKISSNRSSPG